jgi:chemotaxis protein methyltransferase WspC
MKEIERTLRECVGLDAASIGSTLIRRSIRLRMKFRGIQRAEDYSRLLSSSRTEWSELVESVVVGETWFFRDLEPFNALVRLVQEEWLPSHTHNRLRLLSLPCSSGEEPYSIAMALLDAGISPGRLEIDAVDVSARALSRARKGIYGKNSFRGSNLEFRNKHFQLTTEGFVLNPSITKLVRFSEGNVLANDFHPPNSLYDFIFCRNLLIYFDVETQQKALAKIAELLAIDGLLFVGAAEQPLVLNKGFVSAQLPMAFACRKGSVPLPRGLYDAAPLIEPTSYPRLSSPVASDQVKFETVAQSDLDSAKRLADEGHLEEAAKICETHLQSGEPSAQAYYLMGLVRDASGDPAALDYYRKALYLEPDHYDSLLQMAMWSQKNGEAAIARRFKIRAQRVKSRTIKP